MSRATARAIAGYPDEEEEEEEEEEVGALAGEVVGEEGAGGEEVDGLCARRAGETKEP